VSLSRLTNHGQEALPVARCTPARIGRAGHPIPLIVSPVNAALDRLPPDPAKNAPHRACWVAQRSSLGAKMGVIRGGLLRSAVDSGGLESPFRPGWTPGEAHGHRLEIYGSGGWVFESPRAR
jgi:hypothetical protein